MGQRHSSPSSSGISLPSLFNRRGSDDDNGMPFEQTPYGKQSAPNAAICQFHARQGLSLRALFQVFGEHQFLVQGNINSHISKFLYGGEYIRQISSGGHHTLLLTNHGNLLGFGANSDNQLSNCDGNFLSDICRITPTFKFPGEFVIDVSCGYNHSVILTNYGHLMGTGWNTHSQMDYAFGSAYGSGQFSYLNYYKIAKLVRCSNNATAVLSINNIFSICGTLNNQLMFASFSDTDMNNMLSSEETIVDFQCGAQHVILVSSFNNIFALGWNMYGQLGNNSNLTTMTNITKKLPFKRDQFKSVMCGLYHTVFLTTTGAVYASGYNGYGQLGLGDVADKREFTQITEFFKIDTNTISKGILSGVDTSKLQYIKHSLLENEKDLDGNFIIDNNEMIKQVFCGSYHTILISNLGHIYMFGNNQYGQLNFEVDEDIKANPTVKQIIVKSKLSFMDVMVFSNSSANITILAEKQLITQYMVVCLKKIAQSGQLGDVRFVF